MAEIAAEVEALIARMTDDEFAGLVAKTRAPDVREQLREIAARFVPAEALEMFVDTANLSAYTGEDGKFSEARATDLLRRMFASAARALASVALNTVRTA